MYILTKRATDGKQVWHNVHGQSLDVDVARAWYRATRTTDVFEMYLSLTSINESKLESWREQHDRQALEAAGLPKEKR